MLTTNSPVNLKASMQQQLASLPFPDPVIGRLDYLAAFGHFSQPETRLIMTEILNKLVMTWQTGKGLSKLVQLEHRRSSIFDEDVIQGALDRSKRLIQSLGVRAMLRAAEDMVYEVILDNIDEDPGADRLDLTVDQVRDLLKGQSC